MKYNAMKQKLASKMQQEATSPYGKALTSSQNFKIKTAGDKKVCAICASKKGKGGIPPYHPNCRCEVE